MRVLVDVTERKRAAAELEEHQALLDTAVNNAPLVLWAVDREGKVTLSKGKGLEAVGLEPGELVGEMALDLPQDRINIPRALAGEEFSDTVAVGGAVFNTHYRPLRSEDGEVTGVMEWISTSPS